MDDKALTEETGVQFIIKWEQGRVVDVQTNSPPVNHFLELVRLTQAYNTWVNYAHDLKMFFSVVGKRPTAITRKDCLSFIKQQEQAGLSDATINRRLAAVSSLFNELQLLDFPQLVTNPVQPGRRQHTSNQVKRSLYRSQVERLPQIVSDSDLRQFLEALPTWRDRTLVLLMWLSCLRVSEAVAIRFQDVECSRRQIQIPVAKGNKGRVVFMAPFTFTALNRYLDEERRHLFPEVEQLFVAFKGKARGRPLSINAVQKMVGYYSQRCQLPHLHTHLFRHTGITQLVQQGMPEPAVRQFVGHRSPDSLLPYLHLGDGFIEKEFTQAQAGLTAAAWLPAVEGEA